MEVYSKENGRITKQMDMADLYTSMETSMKVIERTEKPTGTGSIATTMAPPTKGSGSMIFSMAKEKIHTKTVLYSKGRSNSARRMEKVSSSGPMEVFIKENSITIKWKEKEPIFDKMGRNITDSGRTT